MDDARFRAYLEGWSRICSSTPETVAAMIEGAAPDIRFSDVNAPGTHDGHDGIRTICELATRFYDGARITYGDLLCDGRNWSIRWTFEGTAPDGKPFQSRGASAGILGEDGRVIEHTDYWNRSALAFRN